MIALNNEINKLRNQADDELRSFIEYSKDNHSLMKKLEKSIRYY
jgi:hypothetical protein